MKPQRVTGMSTLEIDIRTAQVNGDTEKLDKLRREQKRRFARADQRLKASERRKEIRRARKRARIAELQEQGHSFHEAARIANRELV